MPVFMAPTCKKTTGPRSAMPPASSTKPPPTVTREAPGYGAENVVLLVS